MADRGRKKGRWERLQEAIPKHSIVGRVLHPMIEERRTLAGVMSWVGLFMLVAFLAIAAFADFISPYNPTLIVDEPTVPPLTNAPIEKNLSYTFVSPVPLTSWQNAIDGGKRDDGSVMVSQSPSEVIVLRSFGFRLFTDSVQTIQVLIQANATIGAPNHFVDVEVSWDGGQSWSTPRRTVGRTSDADTATNAFDVTSTTQWTREALDDFHLQVRLTHVTESGPPGSVAVDFVSVRTVYLSNFHIMGTDNVGQDVFSRVLHGTRTSLAIMIIGVSVALVVGFPLGLYSGYRGGNLDKTLVLVMDSLYSFPGLLMAGIIAVLLGKGVLNIGLAVTVIYVPLYFRVTRSQVISVREELYVEAARALGAKPSRVMVSYIAYNVLIAVPVIFSLSAADAILTAAGLSFLGWGVEAPTPDWGRDLSAGQQLIDTGVWWPSFYPGLMILLLTVCLSFLGEGLNDIVNPLLKKERS
ncbi:MAG TPA: ABC transporter permease [Thermoplasmata archaeon]|nr:ABC transporter permease [Thermoplasmata archaeon]